MDLLSPIDTIKGVGEKTTKLFNKLGVYTIEDILLFFPRTYLIYPEPTIPNLDSVDSLISIENGAFSYTPLTSIELPNSLQYLSGFSFCSQLTEVVIPESVV